MAKNKGCKAVYCGGQMYCTECGVTWDLDDEPAECKPEVNVRSKQVGIDALTKIKENLNRE